MTQEPADRGPAIRFRVMLLLCVVLALVGGLLSYVVTTVLRGGTPDVAQSSVLEMDIPEGWRAFQIPVGPTLEGGTPYRSSARFDISGTFVRPDTQERVTITLLQDVCVLAVEPSREPKELTAWDLDGTAALQTTVLVTPEEAELLSFSIEKGDISLTMDSDPTNHWGQELRDIRCHEARGRPPDVIKWFDGGLLPGPDPSLIPLFDKN